MSSIRDYIQLRLLTPMRSYSTPVQNAMIGVITDRIEEIYNLTKKFPEIVSPNSSRLDIVDAIIQQFNYKIREEAPIQEQLAILENISYVYKKRGSIDTIENLWKYYGGDLPKDITVRIPSYKLFRYSVSAFSGSDVYQDNNTNRSGVYEILLNNSNYPIDRLRQFLLEEVVAAGNRIYFTNNLYSLLYGDDEEHYYYTAEKDFTIATKLMTSNYHYGMQWSGLGKLSDPGSFSALSGHEFLFVELSHFLEVDTLEFVDYIPYEMVVDSFLTETILFLQSQIRHDVIEMQIPTHHTASPMNVITSKELYDEEGNLIIDEYRGFYFFGITPLGSEGYRN